MDHAALLTGYPGYTLAITTSKETFIFQEKGDANAHFSITFSRDGKLIGTGRAFPKTVPTTSALVMVATFSIQDKSWRDYTEPISDVRAIAVSPDGSKLAYAVREKPPGLPIRLHILDTATGAELKSQEIGHQTLSALSWSPDGIEISYDTYDTYVVDLVIANVPTKQPSIFVLNLRTWETRKIADGRDASWSPSGEWIAFLDRSPDAWDYNRVNLIRPDASEHTVILTLGRSHSLLFGSEQRTIRFAPVWSPDSKRLLVNEYTNADTFTFDLQLLDVSTLKMRRITKGKPPVFGWIVPADNASHPRR